MNRNSHIAQTIDAEPQSMSTITYAKKQASAQKLYAKNTENKKLGHTRSQSSLIQGVAAIGVLRNKQ